MNLAGTLVMVYLFDYLHLMEGHTILMLPLNIGCNSRFRNMQKMADYLSVDGHNVSILTNSKMTPYIFNKLSGKIISHIPEEVDIFRSDYMDSLKQKFTFRNVKNFLEAYYELSQTVCEYLLKDETVINSLKMENYDLFIADSNEDCGRIIASYLEVPLILYSNVGFLPLSDIFYPQINSITCSYSFLCQTNELSFFQRVLQLLMNTIINHVVIPNTISQYKQLGEKYNITMNTNLDKVYANSILVLNADFVSEYPRPFMPNQVPISGLFHEKARPLSMELNDFVKDATDGLIVFSFGTLVDKIEIEKANMFASIFSKLPQKVIWRYKGEIPKNLGKNTLLMDWMPQSDLLAHPYTKLFITHCGISGTYEALYNAVPVIAIPLFVDQHINANKLTGRCGMGILIEDFSDVNEKTLENSINEVLHNPKYKNNALTISQMMKDTPVEPRKRFLHLVNYTIKYDGGGHLISEPAVNMNVFQFYSVDVVLFLTSIFFSVSLVLTISIKMICAYIYKKLSPKKKCD